MISLGAGPENSNLGDFELLGLLNVLQGVSFGKQNYKEDLIIRNEF